MTTTLVIVISVVILAVIFDFLNGFNDAANVVATMIASRSMSPEVALVVAASCEFIGPFLFGTAVANTIGKIITGPVSEWVILASLTGAICWNLITWTWGLPSSSSHALIGGLIGGVTAGAGFEMIKIDVLLKILIALIGTPLVGLIVGFMMKKFFAWLTRGQGPRVNVAFKRVQIFSAAGLALSHGANDAQKSMGIITMVLLSNQYLPEFVVPFWVISICAIAMGLGTAFGGWRIIKTVGTGIYKLRPIHAFSSQVASASVILGAALVGGPVSTTHVVSSSIMGVGAADRMKAVRWHKAIEIVITWFVTIPASAAVAALTYGLFTLLRKV